MKSESGFSLAIASQPFGNAQLIVLTGEGGQGEAFYLFR